MKCFLLKYNPESRKIDQKTDIKGRRMSECTYIGNQGGAVQCSVKNP